MVRRTACILFVALLVMQACVRPADPESSAGSPAEQTTDDPGAALKLGLMFERGTLVSQDLAAAARWYRRAAELGNVAAMFHLAVMYDEGRGVLLDRVEAARWYGRAAATGYGRAEYRLGLMYESGDGVPVDHARAAALFRSAAKHGITAARQKLAAAAAPEGADRNAPPSSATNPVAAPELSPLGGPPPPESPASRTQTPAPSGGPGSAGPPPAGAPNSRPKGDETSLPGPQASNTPAPESQGGGAPPAWADPQLVDIQPELLKRTTLASEDPRLSALVHAGSSIAAAAEGHDGLAAYDLGYCFEHGIGRQKDLVQAYVWYMRAKIAAVDAAVKQAASDAALATLLLLSDTQYQEATTLLTTDQ